MSRIRNDLTAGLPDFVTFLYLVLVTLGAFAGGTWGIIGIGGAILLFVAVTLIDKRAPMPDIHFLAMASLTLSVMALSNLNSSEPHQSWFDWRRLAGVFIPLLLLSGKDIIKRTSSPKLFPVIVVGASIGALALFFELQLGGPLLKWLKGPRAELFEYNRGLSYLILLAFPMLAWMWTTNRRRFLLPFVIILILPAGLTESRAAKLALCLGLVTTAIACLWPRGTRRAISVMIVGLLAWPFAAQQFFLHHRDLLQRFPDSWHARMEIWDYLSYRILDRPWFGWGLGASRSLDYIHPHGADYVFITSQPASHPHNVITQLWVELGLPGLALGFLFAYLTLGRIAKMDPRTGPFALGGWTAALCLALVAYNFWTDSLFAAFALTSFAFALLKIQQKEV